VARAYYKVHHEIFPSIYSFRDEVGDTGTDIGFVDAATLYNGACEIISSWQSHRAVLRLTDDVTAGEDPNIGIMKPTQLLELVNFG